MVLVTVGGRCWCLLIWSAWLALLLRSLLLASSCVLLIVLFREFVDLFVELLDEIGCAVVAGVLFLG